MNCRRTIEKGSAMAEDNELQERLDRIQRWAQNLRDVLNDGDEIVVRCDGDEVHVEETPFGRFQALHPRLSGRLASIEAQLEMGCLLYLGTFLLPVSTILGLRLQWWDDWLGPALASELNNWWCYLALFSATAYLVNQVYDRLRRRVYRRHRTELFAMIHAEGLDRDTLLPLLQGADDLSGVIRQLKLDPGPFPAADRETRIQSPRPRLLGGGAEELP
jgi:hypothetical protein